MSGKKTIGKKRGFQTITFQVLQQADCYCFDKVKVAGETSGRKPT
jgi:hypothetical protein